MVVFPFIQLGALTLIHLFQDGRLRFATHGYSGEDAEGSQEVLSSLQEETEAPGRYIP